MEGGGTEWHEDVGGGAEMRLYRLKTAHPLGSEGHLVR